MASIHTYTVRGAWTGDKFSVGRITSEGLTAQFSIPNDLGGPGVGTNPEELLLSAAAGCYLITLSAILSNRRIPFARIDLESVGYVENDRGLRFDRIEHRPTIVLDRPYDEEQLITLAEHAEHACMVSSAVRGNVAVHVSPRVIVEAARV
ncbi:hypothetical protein GCM10010885_22190 [Alicyclobacillus cellulosilyticus]|uniref:Peroxiredoxin-like protein n=1 Tax=Alicyclobacillus cellulosilyticus TaxID=1003997 RepID=A0A917NN11_9BACL|nr:OsmC family protein [Alicyclobacillus cellulosilyticus]GGJ12378.1 hypothetical protein GCM10010885_22190 [Alicyclobacillus cellulosilyticus]